MIQTATPNPTSNNPAGIEKMLQVFLAIILVAILLPLPRAGMAVNHPYKIELLLSLFLITFFILKLRAKEQREWFTKRAGSCLRPVFLSLILFTLWSGVSAIWAKSLDSVVHHTLLWSIFSVFLLIFTGLVRPGVKFITGTFTVVSVIIALLCILDYLTISDFTLFEHAHRVRYAKSAELLVTLSPVLWAAAIYARKRGPALLLAAALSWVTVMLSLSKGAFIAGIAGSSIFFIGSAVFGMRRFRKRAVTVATVWLILTIATQVFFSAFSAFPSTADYITGAADPSRTSSNVRLFIWKVALQMAADNWLTGLGADNFAMNLNEARARFRQNNPAEPKEEIAEDYLLERAHNEPFQILTELGAIGLGLFLLPFVIFALCFLRYFRHNRSRISPMLWASLAGTAAFMLSSLFSSFSFRSAQNGVVFFAVLAIAVNEMAKLSRKSEGRSVISVFPLPVYLLAWLCALSLAFFGLSKTVAEYHVYQAERSESYAEAENHFQIAVLADSEYAGAYFLHAARASKEGSDVEAAPLTRKAINLGIGAAVAYLQLAKRQIAAGQRDNAEATFREALAIYPRSIFLRTEFSIFLENHGMPAEAEEQLAAARLINLRHANGWHLLIKHGSVTAFYRAQSDPNIAPPAELMPYEAVIPYVDAVRTRQPDR